MLRCVVTGLIALGFLTIISSTYAQSLGKVYRKATDRPVIGILVAGQRTAIGERLDAFRKGLRDLGYVEDKNLVIEYRYAGGELDRLPLMAAEFIRLSVAVIVTTSTASTKAAKQATTTIPIVVGSAGDLVGDGLVPSLARPDGNVTGFTAISPDLSGKPLELLKETISKASRVAVIWYPNANDEREVKATELAAKPMGLTLRSYRVQSPEDIQKAFIDMAKEHVDGVIMVQSPFMALHHQELLELAIRNRLLSMCDAPNLTESGCSMSYGPNRLDMYRRAAGYVDKLLKGAKPADLPVQQPMKFEFVVNLKTAKQIGVTISPNVLARADG